VPSGGGGSNIIVYPYYPWGFYGPGYGYGLGYLFYDPWYGGGYGYGYPYGYGGYGYGGHGYGGYGYGGYDPGGGSGGYAVSRGYKESGSLRLKIDPKQAQVYVDGYFVGVVDSFDGAFQKLELDGGGHKIELKSDGFQPLDFEVLITPGETVTYKGEMKRIQ
jgi:PEGA domain